MKLPLQYRERMKDLLGGRFEAFEAGYEAPPFRGLRINRLKCCGETLFPLLPFRPGPTPFSPDGFYLPEGAEGLGKHPLHHAGAFYIQEPSAMAAVTALAPEPGEKILDLCAAPGGKSTQIASALGGRGLLWANEVVGSRAKILLSNIERMGIGNAVVSSCRPEVLCAKLAGYFDRILVDAPCSGEGMLRREPETALHWSVENIRACAGRQRKILESAAEALRPGGMICYSTCTFAPEENEGTVTAFLRAHPEFRLAEIAAEFGCPAFAEDTPGLPEITKARRIFPEHGGEGHFVALLRHTGGSLPAGEPEPEHGRPDEAVKAFFDFWRGNFEGDPPGTPASVGGQVFLQPALPDFGGLYLLRAGILAGESLKGRFSPAHALFAAAGITPRRILDFTPGDPALAAFLRGEQISAGNRAAGYAGVRAAGIPLGFGKISDGVCKNHYPKGLRNF